MAESKNSHSYLGDMSGIGLPTNSLEPIFGSPGSCSEFKGFSDGKMREMAIDFLIIKDLSLEEGNNYLDRDRRAREEKGID